MWKHRVAAPCLLALLAACGGGPSAVGPGSSSFETLSLKLETAHFRVLADRAAPSALRQVADALEANCARIVADLGAADLRTTTVEVWTDAESFYRDMEATIGARFNGSSGYVSGPANLAVLGVSSAPTRSAVHEFSHCVSLRVNASLANNPRWLWETVALYENGEFIDPRTLDFLRAGRYPTIADLDAPYDASHQVYQVGYVLGEFVVANWGQAGLVNLVRTNGDIERVTGLTVAEFERRWHAFLKDKYLG